MEGKRGSNTGLYIVIVICMFILLSCVIFFYGVNSISKINVNTIEEMPLKEGDIAIVKIEEELVESEKYIKWLTKYRKSKKIKGVILEMNTPGGGVTPSQEILNEVKRIRESGKKVYVYMGTVCASGGYYIASGADRLYASPGSVTGSIGVISIFINQEKFWNWVGFKFKTIKSGKYKDVGSPFREMTEEEEVYFRELIDDIYTQFLNSVIEGRKEAVKKVLSESEGQVSDERIKEYIENYSDGRILTGAEAKRLGFIDELGDLQSAIDGLKTALSIEGEPNIVRPPKKTKWQQIMEIISDDIHFRIQTYKRGYYIKY